MSLDLNDVQSEVESLKHKARLTIDLQNNLYDDQILMNMCRSEQTQTINDNHLSFTEQGNKNFFRYSVNSTISKFKLTNDELEALGENILTVKLQAYRFMEIAILKIGNEPGYYNFYSQCAANLAIKINVFCVVDCLSDLHRNEEARIKRWQFDAFNFENTINDALQWNCSVITANCFLQFFLDAHFPSQRDSIDYSKMESFICETYLEHKWTGITIALGCLSHYFALYKEEEFKYLIYLIQFYLTEFETFGFNSELISSVKEYLDYNFDDNANYLGYDDDEDFSDDDEQGNNGSPASRRNNTQPRAQSDNQESDSDQTNNERQQNEEDNSDQEDMRVQRANSVVSSQTVSITTTYNKKRSSTQCNFECKQNAEKPLTNKCRSKTMQMIATQESDSAFGLDESELGLGMRKKVKTSSNLN